MAGFRLAASNRSEFVAALEQSFDRDKGELEKDFVRRWLNMQADGVMMRARKAAALAPVDGDVVEEQP